MLTIRPQQTGASAQTVSLSNVHGDVFITLDATGTVLGSTVAGPFGESITGQTLPVNGATGVSYSYVGKHLKATEAQLTIKPMQMGARVYLPSIGRFTSVDPVQGGTPNPYTYVTDPVNDFDLSGQWSLKKMLKSVKGATKNVGKSVAAAVKKITTSPQGSGAASSPIKPKSTFDFKSLPKASSPINSATKKMSDAEFGLYIIDAAGQAYSYAKFGTYWGTQIGGRRCGFLCAEIGSALGGGAFAIWGLMDHTLGYEDRYAWWEEPIPGQTPYK